MKLILLFSLLEVSDIIVAVVGSVLAILLSIIGYGINNFIGEVRDLKHSLDQLLIDNSSFTTMCKYNTKATEDALKDHHDRIEENTVKISKHDRRISLVEEKIKVK